MKITADTKALKEALEAVAKVVPDKPSHPILSNVRIEARDNLIALTGFDLSIAIEWCIKGDIEKEGSITIPSKLLSEIVKHLPQGELILEADDENIATLISSSGKYQIRGLPSTEYPELPEVRGAEGVKVEVKRLLAGATALDFSSPDETKQILTGIHLKIAQDNLGINGIEFATTDGHRLFLIESLTEGKLLEGESEITSLTIPARAYREVERMLLGQKDSEESVLIRFDDTQITFSHNNKLVVCRRLEGSYPLYHQLIPPTSEIDITLDRRSLIGSLERIGVVAKQSSNIVKCSIDHSNQQIALSVEAADVGNALETLPAQISGESVKNLAFNVKYLIEGLKAFDTSEVVLKIVNATAPILALPLGGQDKTTYLIMPVQLRN